MMKKYKPLEVGQRVWLETISMFVQRESMLHECEIVRVNKTSAYAVHVEDLSKLSPYERRINQRTKEVDSGYSAGYKYRIWYSKDAFDTNRDLLKEKLALREVAVKKVNKMTLSELIEFTKSN